MTPLKHIARFIGFCVAVIVALVAIAFGGVAIVAVYGFFICKMLDLEVQSASSKDCLDFGFAAFLPPFFAFAIGLVCYAAWQISKPKIARSSDDEQHE